MCSIENGPVIFSGDAAACVFARAFVEKGAILARRHNMKIAHDGTLIALQTEPALAKELDRMIVSRTVDVTAVDALTAYNGLSLIGNFYIDADGMKVENDWDIIVQIEKKYFLIVMQMSIFIAEWLRCCIKRWMC